MTGSWSRACPETEQGSQPDWSSTADGNSTTRNSCINHSGSSRYMELSVEHVLKFVTKPVIHLWIW